jgi:hypothetical protein
VLGELQLVRGVSYGNLLDQGDHLLDAIPGSRAATASAGP